MLYYCLLHHNFGLKVIFFGGHSNYYEIAVAHGRLFQNNAVREQVFIKEVSLLLKAADP